MRLQVAPQASSLPRFATLSEGTHFLHHVPSLRTLQQHLHLGGLLLAVMLVLGLFEIKLNVLICVLHALVARNVRALLPRVERRGARVNGRVAQAEIARGAEEDVHAQLALLVLKRHRPHM